MICNLPGYVSLFLGNTKYQEINFSVVQVKEQNDKRDEAYFLLYSIQLFSVVFCSPVFLDFMGHRARWHKHVLNLV